MKSRKKMKIREKKRLKDTGGEIENSKREGKKQRRIARRQGIIVVKDE